MTPRQDLATASLRRPAKAIKRLAARDRFFRRLTRSAALIVLLLLGGVIASLIGGSMQAFHKFGLEFFRTQTWSPGTQTFGAAAAIYGTAVTSAIAMVIAAPVGVGIAAFLTDLGPRHLRRPIGVAIELLAGIPSVIYGVWGLFLFAPFMKSYVQPALIALAGDVPGLASLFAGPPLGVGVLTASIVLAIMALPFVAAIMRDVFETAPPMLKESAYALGCTEWEVVRNIVIPHARLGVLGALALGLGRALGEAMAVAFVVGNAHNISASLLAPGRTIPATIALELPEAVGDLYRSSLIALGLILFVIAFLVLALARLMLMRLEAKAGK